MDYLLNMNYDEIDFTAKVVLCGISAIIPLTIGSVFNKLNIYSDNVLPSEEKEVSSVFNKLSIYSENN
ncbi:MAG: hypothetical protein K0B02_01630 [DPANN group archaeon]|nr:hypothetical protein [DPANN group archaeon]